MTWGMIGSAVVGGVLSRSQKSGGGTTTENKQPWAPAQPYILDSLKSGQQLRDYYRQNPFNPQQKTSYQNMFGDIDNFRQNTAPGLMDFANNAMGSNYQRQRGGAVGGGAGYGGLLQPGGQQGLSQNRPFSANPGQQYGQIDFNAQNPFRNGGITEPVVPTAPAVDPQRAAYEEYLRQQQGGGGGGGDSGMGGDGGNGGAGTAGNAGSDGSAADGTGDGGPGGVGAWANGGRVSMGLLGGPNPAGPDDGYGALDHGEFVIRKDAVDKYGGGVMRAINAGKVSAKELAALVKKAK